MEIKIKSNLGRILRRNESKGCFNAAVLKAYSTLWFDQNSGLNNPDPTPSSKTETRTTSQTFSTDIRFGYHHPPMTKQVEERAALTEV